MIQGALEYVNKIHFKKMICYDIESLEKLVIDSYMCLFISEIWLLFQTFELVLPCPEFLYSSL